MVRLTRHLVLLIGLLCLLAACSGPKPASGPGEGPGNEQQVIPTVDGEPMPGGFGPGVYERIGGTCEAIYANMGIGPNLSGQTAIWGPAGTIPLVLEEKDKKQCFPWNDGQCCLELKAELLVMACSFSDGTTCESTYRKNSDFNIDTVFSSLKATAIDAEPIVDGASLDDATVNRLEGVAAKGAAADAQYGSVRDGVVALEGAATIEAMSWPEYASVSLSDIVLQGYKRIFSREGLALYQPAFLNPEAIFRGGSKGPGLQFVGDRYAYDPSNFKLYLIKRSLGPLPLVGDLFQFRGEDVYLPRQSGGYVLWLDADGKNLTAIADDQGKNISLPLPAGVTVLDMASMENQVYLLTRKGNLLDVQVNPLNPATGWSSLGLNYPLKAPSDGARLLAKPGAIVVGLPGVVLLNTCAGLPWEWHTILPYDTIIALISGGLFFSDNGTIYALVGGHMAVQFTVDMFVHRRLEPSRANLLPFKIVRCLESAKRLFFVATATGAPERSRYIGWLDRP